MSKCIICERPRESEYEITFSYGDGKKGTERLCDRCFWRARDSAYKTWTKIVDKELEAKVEA